MVVALKFVPLLVAELIFGLRKEVHRYVFRTLFVLPAVVPELRYDTLNGVQDGGMAMDAFLEGIRLDTPPERKAQIEQQLLAYCKLDTYAMVRLWQVFSGRTDSKL